MAKPQVYALVRLPNGQIVKRPVSFQGVEKMEKRITDDYRRKLWLNKTHYKYLDDKNKAES